MKTTKIVVIAVAVTIALILACGIATASADSELVPCVALVTSIDADLFTCTDACGELWGFYSDPSDFVVGDLVVLLLWHDEVIDVYFVRHYGLVDAVRWLEN